MTRPPSFPQKKPDGRSRKEAYKEDYEASKKEGERFFPETIFKDAIVALIVFAAIFIVALAVPVKVDPVADPTSTTYNPRPEWYFLFLFQFLKYFPGSLEPVAAIIIPGTIVVVLLLLPFIDRRRQRHPLQRPAVTVGAVVILAAMAFLTMRGALSPFLNPGQEDPLIAEGRRIYVQLECSYCHAINGAGGAVGPDLGVVTKGLKAQDVRTYLQNPHAMFPNSLHPKLQFTQDELNALSAYVASLGAVPVYTADAPRLFQQYCSGCHAINGQGGHVGPDLSGEGNQRSVSFLVGFISNPKTLNPSSVMPEFDKTLSNAQIADLANYLAAQRGGTPTPTPPPVTSTPTATPTTTTGATTPAGTPTLSPFPTQSPAAVSYAKDVQPLFSRSCAPCHTTTALGGLDLNSYKGTTTTGDHAPDVQPGKADASLLYQVMQGPASGVPQMPLGGAAVPPDQLKLVRDWINAGASNN